MSYPDTVELKSMIANHFEQQRDGLDMPGDTHEWRYTEHGAVTHYVNVNSPSSTALCGVSVLTASEWRGSGTQAEHERAQRMAQCRQCKNRLTRKVIG